MNSKRFEECLIKLGAVWETKLPEAQRLVDDTREIRKGDIYVLRQGAQPLSHSQAESLIKQAEQSGVTAIILDPEFKEMVVACAEIILPNPHLHLGDLAEAFYGNPSTQMKMIAVTGTNGKTTTTYLIESLAKTMGVKVGVLGTISYRYPGYEEASVNTTPGTLKLYRLLSEMQNAGCELVAMEVSSHGIVQGRIDGVYFDAAIWNNLGTDHLDFHHTRESYALAKQRLFHHYLVESYRHHKNPVAIGNIDDREVMDHILSANPESWGGKFQTFSGFGNQNADIFIRDIVWQNGSYGFEIVDKKTNNCVQTKLPLIGPYNLYNCAGAVAALVSLGYSLERLGEFLPLIAQIPGRMEGIHVIHPTVIVDFAHTPEALEKALDAARSCVSGYGKLVVVFGAGGDRDPGKRPMMGAAAFKKADKIYVTSDNPRTEDPKIIIDQVMEGITDKSNTIAIVDRKLAIEQALRDSGKEDLVLIAGKGHEDYQILGTQKVHFDDREVVRNYLSKNDVSV